MDAQSYKNTMKCFASGVTVLNWREDSGFIQGITVSAFSSLSLAPPLVLFCITHHAYVRPQLQLGKRLAINILRRGQKDIAYRFAGSDRSDLEALFAEDNPETLPYLQQAHASMSVVIEEVVRGGDHDVFFARVLHSTVDAEAPPLLYHRGVMHDE